MKTIVIGMITLAALATASQAATITWDDGAGDDYWSSGVNWDAPEVAPTNGDSVVLTATAQSRLDYAWTIESGESLTSTATSLGDELVLETNSVLTLASGGAMDIRFMRPRFTSGGQFIIEPGAILNTDHYGLSAIAATITFIADAAGVTTWTNLGQFQMGSDNLVVDLSSYNISNGTTLVLVDYNVVGDLGGETFGSVSLTGGDWNGNIDYAYDQGGGDLAIALTNIGQPATLTWDNGGTGTDFATPDNWDPDQVPVSGSDSVVLNFSAGISDLTTEFVIASGQSMTATNSPSNDTVLRIGDGGNLVVATGGTLDLLAGSQQGNIAELGAAGGQSLTIEAGATARVYRYWNDEISYTNRFIADASGVTTFEIESNFALRGSGSVLDIDLSNYDTNNGPTLVLFDYGVLLLQNGTGFGATNLTAGWFGTIDYVYDQGGGDLAVALVSISEGAPPAITSNGTPHSWLDLYGLVTGGDYEAADLLESDGDGKLNWEEYQDGTDPTGTEFTPVTPVAAPTNGVPDELTFAAPDTPWVIEATTDGTEWGVVPFVTFVVNPDGSITATVEELPALGSGGTYRVVEKQKNSKLVVFLTEGQSNMVGYAPDASSNVYGMADHPLPNMLQLSHGHSRHFYDSGAANELIGAFQPLQASEVPGQQADEADAALDFYFARAYAEDHPEEDVLIIKNAFGGSGFANNQWNDGDPLDALVTPYFAGAFSQNDLSNRYDTIEFGGILWHQGEADTKTDVASAAYTANLPALVARHRGRVADYIANDAPFILGTMQYYRIDNFFANFAYMVEVDAIHRDIANLVPKADFVDLHDLQGTTQIHFTIDEYKTAGERYYQKWLELVPATTTSNGTSIAWLDLYNLVTNGNYEAVDLLDSDLDGRPNWEEYQDGTNPTGGVEVADIDVLFVESAGAAPDTLNFLPPDEPWVIEASTNLVFGDWVVLPSVTFDTEDDGSITATAAHEALDACAFYRLVEPRQNSTVVIFLTEGQSNMQGGSSDAAANEYDIGDLPLRDMFQQSRGHARDFYEPEAPNDVVRAYQPLQTTHTSAAYETRAYTALDFYFAREYAADNPDHDVLIVKNAVGGTGFRNNHWNAGDDLDVLVTPYLQAALNDVTGRYDTVRFGGILWHQGEADKAAEDAYETNLVALVTRHRGYVGSEMTNSAAPFICGTMVSRWMEERTSNYVVNAVHTNIANLVSNAACADLSDLDQEGWPLTNHFLTDEYEIAGQRYYIKWLDVATDMGW